MAVQCDKLVIFVGQSKFSTCDVWPSPVYHTAYPPLHTAWWEWGSASVGPPVPAETCVTHAMLC